MIESRIANRESRRGESRAVVHTALPLPLYRRGKVRDIYALEGSLLIVATDRLSAFDHILPTPIPDRGRVLTQLSAFWFGRTGEIVPNHMVTADSAEIAALVPQLADVSPEVWQGRLMLVRRCHRIDVECVVRGYLAGSAWQEYQQTGAVAGIPQPAGLRSGDALPAPILTPATKATHGHDDNITCDQMAEVVGSQTATLLRELSLALYRHAADHALRCGLVLADTKFEFGLLDGRISLIDEALTPDSSRYWDAASYPTLLVPFDKQLVRDYLNEIGWNHEPPVPELPPAVVEATRARYLETYRRLTGTSLEALDLSSRA